MNTDFEEAATEYVAKEEKIRASNLEVILNRVHSKTIKRFSFQDNEQEEAKNWDINFHLQSKSSLNI